VFGDDFVGAAEKGFDDAMGLLCATACLFWGS
jgi:hypothetical protein